MRTKRLISLALILALMLTLAPLSLGSHADEKRPTAEDFELIPIDGDYEYFDYYSEGLVSARTKTGWGYLDDKGNVVVDFFYDIARPFSGGLAIVGKKMENDFNYGLINQQGELVLPLEYSKIKLYHMDSEYGDGNSEYLYEVEKGGKFGIANQEGKLILPLRDSGYTFLGADRIKYRENETDFLFDFSGALVAKTNHNIGIYSEGLAVVTDKNYMRGYVDRFGKIVIPIQFRYAQIFKNGLAHVTNNDKSGFVDKTGKVVVPLEYEDSHYFFHEGLVPVKKDGRGFVIDETGKVVIELNPELGYEGVSEFINNHAMVRSNSNKKMGLMDKSGKIVVPFEYENIAPLLNADYYWVSKGEIGKNALIDHTGKVLLPFKYESYFGARKFYDGLLRVQNSENKKFGFINEKAELVIPEDYYFVSHFSDGVAWATKEENGISYLIDKAGHRVLDDVFTSVAYKADPHPAVPFFTLESKPFSEGKVLATQKYSDGSKKSFIIRDKRYVGAPSTVKPKGYVYDEADKGEGLVLPTDELATVKDKTTAAEAVNKAIAGATEEQKTSATGTDLLTLYGEEAALRTAKTEVEGSEFIIDKAGVEKVENTAIEAKAAVEAALKDGGVTTQRELSTGVIYEVKEGDKLSVKVDASSAEAKADNVRVETPTYSLSFNKKALASIKDEDTTPLEITVTELPASSAELTEPRTENPSQSADFSGTSSYSLSQNAHPSYSGSAFPSLSGTHIPSKALGANILEDAASKIFDIKFSKKIKEKIKLSLPVIKGNPNYQAVYDSTGKAIGGKYNPVTKKLDVKINKSDKYVVKEKKKSFADITSKSKEMQDAIEILASKGIIAGTSPTNFSPDGAITRAEIAALILRSISKLNPSENGGFSDVTSADWYYGAVGSAKRYGIMNGVSKTHFAPKKSILKDQIVAVAARVLKEEMGYLAPAGPEAFLGSYTDAASIPNWAKSDVALATREGLVVKRYDSAFIPAGTMTRGDVAVILHRLFKKLW